ncbi:hypothetical protein [Pseudonocardia sp. ICBG601]|nr:hypothetical protein [Pseudonocardia sp. ICBG601]
MVPGVGETEPGRLDLVGVVLSLLTMGPAGLRMSWPGPRAG